MPLAYFQEDWADTSVPFWAGVFEVDLAAGKITVHDPATYALPDGQKWEKLSFKGRRPRLLGKIESNEVGLFLFDLGANSSLTVYAPAVERFKLLEGRETTETKSGGVGWPRNELAWSFGATGSSLSVIAGGDSSFSTSAGRGGGLVVAMINAYCALASP